MEKDLKSINREINLSELFAVIWAYKFFIILVVSSFTFLAGYKAITTEKRYTARAVFQIEQENNSGLSIPSEIASLVSLSGLGGASGTNSDKDLLLERVVGREFILYVNKQSNLDLDPYFNSYDPEYTDISRVANIKRFLNWNRKERDARKLNDADHKAIIENNIIANYRNNVKFSETESGAIAISVQHASPAKASKYANRFMENIRQLVEEENNTAQELKLNYLSETLADALQDMETTQKNLTAYALQNSAEAKERFMAGSLQLDDMRMEKRKAAEFGEVLSILGSLVASGNLDTSSYEALRSTHPLVDDIDFRRILGMSETISDWTWPKAETIGAVSLTLRERIKRLNVDIKTIEENAEIYATSAEDLANFTRDAKIAEATYTVIIQQVKSQYLSAGFQPNTFQVFEYATPPLHPSSPNTNVILVLGTFIGFIIGCILAFTGSIIRGVYYTRSALVADINAKLSIKSKSIRRLSRISISRITEIISKRRVLEADELEIKLANKKLIYFLNNGGRMTSSGTARVLAAQSSKSGRKVVICDTTAPKIYKELDGKAIQYNGELPIVKLDNDINIVTELKGAAFFASSSFTSAIKDLITEFDQVIICSSNQDSNLGLMALKDFNPSIVLLAGLRSTKRLDIEKLKVNQQIDVLIYD